MFPWIEPLLGGLMIGAAAALFLISNDRIAGISGIAGGLVCAKRSDRGWRLGFVGGLVSGGVLMALVYPSAFQAPGLSMPLLISSGLLVGVGTSLARGCTSGHGVCGVSRLSKRSLVATSTFMLCGVVVAVLAHRVFGIGGAV